MDLVERYHDSLQGVRIAGFEMTEEKDMAKVTFDYSKASKFISDDEVVAMKKIAEDAKEVLVNKSGAGNDFLGWN